MNNQRHGKGLYRLNNGEVYDGNFMNGEYDGFGMMIYLSGDVYEGDWRRGGTVLTITIDMMCVSHHNELLINHRFYS
jgi:hypothetical protein